MDFQKNPDSTHVSYPKMKNLAIIWDHPYHQLKITLIT